MALIDLQQTDTVGCGSPAAFCSDAASFSGDIREATDGGTAGTTEVTAAVSQNTTNRAAHYNNCIIPSGASWDAGTWTVRLDVTNGNMQIDLEKIFICRINSSCVNQETIGSDSTLNTNLQTPQVYSFSISGSAVTPSAGDEVMIVFVFDNNDSMMSQSIGITPSQIINTPFDDGVTGAVKDIIMSPGIIPFVR